MGNKKNIDRVFQEQFKNFEAAPNDVMWDSIQSKLDENDSSKKRIPLWVFYSGLVATIIVFVGLSVTVLSTDDGVEKIVVAPEKQNLINSDELIFDREKEVLFVNQNAEKLNDSGLKNRQSTISGGVQDLNDNVLVNVSLKSNNVGVSTTITSNRISKGLRDKNSTKLLLNKDDLLKKKTELSQNRLNEVVLNKEMAPGLENRSLEAVDNQNVITESNNTVVNNDKLNSRNIARSTSVFLENNKENNKELKQKKSKLDENGFIVASSVVVKENSQEENLTNTPNISLNKGLSLTNVVGYVSADDIVVESRVISGQSSLFSEEGSDSEVECIAEEVEVPFEKAIEEAIAELEEELEEAQDEEEEVAFNKWKIAPNIAPVYYNTLSSGSPIDNELSGNKKKGKINMSYGLGVGYAISKKLTLRTGINKVSLGFDTEDVAVSTNQETVSSVRSMKNINLSPAVVSLNITSSESLSLAQIPASFSSLYNSSLNQRLGYLEVPLELSYKISDKKMKIDVIAGVSTFFLNKNEIYAVTNGIETHIGEANNLNKMSYSTNIGLGFNYNISKAFNFNFEPTFKYQLNAFSNDSGNFKPYILGVYTGFSFKF